MISKKKFGYYSPKGLIKSFIFSSEWEQALGNLKRFTRGY